MDELYLPDKNRKTGEWRLALETVVGRKNSIGAAKQPIGIHVVTWGGSILAADLHLAI